MKLHATNEKGPKYHDIWATKHVSISKGGTKWALASDSACDPTK